MAEEESRRTVLMALGANVAVGVVKFTGAALTGSAALFAEGAESVSDTLNEAFLLAALRRSHRPADARHPFGYGKERFFWTLLAAVGIFVSGAGFSAFEAYRAFTGGSTVEAHYYPVAYTVLALVLAAEGTSWVRAMRQIRQEAAAAGRSLLFHIRESSDPSVKTVAGEDTVAILGVLLAAAGIGLHQITGAGFWEGFASAGIALLLVATAFLLGWDVKDLLIGEAVGLEMRRDICSLLLDHEAVDSVVDLLTMRIGADQVLLAARLDLSRDLDSDAVEEASAELDRRINERWPEITQVFLDATRAGERISPSGI
jgi:cation diffusion facilitator family transporter